MARLRLMVCGSRSQKPGQSPTRAPFAPPAVCVTGGIGGHNRRRPHVWRIACCLLPLGGPRFKWLGWLRCPHWACVLALSRISSVSGSCPPPPPTPPPHSLSGWPHPLCHVVCAVCCVLRVFCVIRSWLYFSTAWFGGSQLRRHELALVSPPPLLVMGLVVAVAVVVAGFFTLHARWSCVCAPAGASQYPQHCVWVRLSCLLGCPRGPRPLPHDLIAEKGPGFVLMCA
jgi:hypothetical protein